MPDWLKDVTLLGAVRRITDHPKIVPATALALRARAVRRSLEFVAREILGDERPRTYRLRANGLNATIRHGSGDVVTLGEVFHEYDYEPPEVVAAALGTPSRILDLGANIGLFGLYAVGRWPSARVDAFEPDPANAAVHQRSIVGNGLGARWFLQQEAAGAEDGMARFASGGVALSSLDESGDIVVTVRDVLDAMAGADLVKMDIEGGEWPILQDPRFAAAPPRVLVLEYHPGVGCPSSDPHGTVRELLARAGMITSEIWTREDGYGMLWAWRA